MSKKDPTRPSLDRETFIISDGGLLWNHGHAVVCDVWAIDPVRFIEICEKRGQRRLLELTSLTTDEGVFEKHSAFYGR